MSGRLTSARGATRVPWGASGSLELNIQVRLCAVLPHFVRIRFWLHCCWVHLIHTAAAFESFSSGPSLPCFGRQSKYPVNRKAYWVRVGVMDLESFLVSLMSLLLLVWSSIVMLVHIEWVFSRSGMDFITIDLYWCVSVLVVSIVFFSSPSTAGGDTVGCMAVLSGHIVEFMPSIVYPYLKTFACVMELQCFLSECDGDKSCKPVFRCLHYASCAAFSFQLTSLSFWVSFADPVAVRHALEILSELATRDPYAVAMALGRLAEPGGILPNLPCILASFPFYPPHSMFYEAGALQDVLHLHDVLARVSLARLCYTISRARALDERPDIRSQFNSVLYQLLLDPSERVCFEAIFCVLGKSDNTERTEERAAGWYRLTREILKLPEAPSVSSREASKDKTQKTRRPQPLIKLVMRRLESSFRSFSRPVLHAAARVVQEMGKSRAAAFALGLQDIDEGAHVNTFADAVDSHDSDANENLQPESTRKASSVSNVTGGKETIAGLLASLMEVVRTTVACECVYVRAMVIKALIWMQSPHESFDELESIIASELSDPAWPATLLNDILLTLHARFKATPDMAVTLLEIARVFATKVPGKIDADVLQLLWKVLPLSEFHRLNTYNSLSMIQNTVVDNIRILDVGIAGSSNSDLVPAHTMAINKFSESVIRSNLQYAALSALRRLPLDPGNPAFLHRAVQGCKPVFRCLHYASCAAFSFQLTSLSFWVSFADPVAVRHALEILSELATRDPYAVAMALGRLAEPGGILPNLPCILASFPFYPPHSMFYEAGALQDVLHLHDVLARVSLARLCYTISRARALDERPDIRSQFNSVLYQLLLDPSERVCFEAIFCVLGKSDNTERTEERAAGWYRLTREILKLPEAPSVSSREASKDKTQKTRRPQPLIKLVMRRLESSFRSFSRPVLHAAARVVQEMGKSRAAAFALGLQDIDEGAHVNTFADAVDSHDSDANENLQPESTRKASSVSNVTGGKETIAGLLASLMEVVRTTVACECVYVRAMVIKALIWMQSPHESFDELESIIASELSDPAWPATLLNDILLTLHARFKATPDMAVTLLEIARVFATKVPGKIDADVLQLLWKVLPLSEFHRLNTYNSLSMIQNTVVDNIRILDVGIAGSSNSDLVPAHTMAINKFSETCLVGAGPDGKHTALEAVTIVLDLPPPQPGSMSGLTSVDSVSASDPKSALALQRLVQAAVWFLGENANYAASEYAWESATPPGTALMMLDADKMVAAASSRNPTLAGALTRLQRCAFSGSWEIRITAAQALTTIAIRSGEPFRLQIYEFLHTLAHGGLQSQLSEMHLSNGEDQGASGTGLGVLMSPMIKVLDEMYRAQDDLIKEIRNHDNAKKEWADEELKKLYETHERLLDLVSLFCFVPRAKYLPLGPISAKLLDIYRTRHNISTSTGLSDPAVATGISDLVYEFKPVAAEPDALDDDLVNAWAANLGDDDLLGNNAPAMSRVNEFLAGVGADAPEVDDENIISRPSVSYDDMWAKTLLEPSEQEEDDARSSGTSSPESTGSVESSISSHFGGVSYPSLFSSRPTSYGASQTSERPAASRFSNPSVGGTSMYEGRGSPIREEPSSYSYESFENPLAANESQSFGAQKEERVSSGNQKYGTALYDFTAGGDDELNLTAGEEVEIEEEMDGWFYVKKKRPGRDGKMAGLVPVLYVNQS
ncbi:hypothetical protein CJ030_MR5G025398 [Morella rubra]|uniref:SH3 domain-containing protein n=2 Tax=Magnoliopsida TaxID=3398 RepID=A0A6A1VGZ5_9ROSI|nr:hypothetical protein CJ030_MR5G025398 [Morella rubra]